MQPFPTYKHQEKLIHEAYIKGEIQPYDAQFCFCGTLSPNKNWYAADDYPQFHNYTYYEYREMEAALLLAIQDKTGSSNHKVYVILNHPLYEEGLFNGMVNALKVLRQIHESKGEVIDDEPIFLKRKLLSDAI